MRRLRSHQYHRYFDPAEPARSAIQKYGNYIAIRSGDGTYTITVGQLKTSKLICPQDIMQQEQKYLEILQQASQARIQENQIILDSPLGNLTFYLIKEN